ncbi:MAG: amino acid racemase [Negativicutes bacterium]|nr:amino acid racemase [Negativicutes bacterium]
MAEKVIGIIGGMGPEATADLYLKIIHNTPADTDQQHLHVLIDSNTKIPDRTAAIMHGGEDPAPFIAETGRNLFRAGADYLAISCNTAHYYYDAVQAAVPIPVLHMPKICLEYIQENYPNLTCCGLLATSATIETGLYQSLAEKAGLEMLPSLPEIQANLVMEGIRKIKAGRKEEGGGLLKAAANALIERGAEVIIAGCTEIPLVLQNGSLRVPVVDPTLIMALKIIEMR